MTETRNRPRKSLTALNVIIKEILCDPNIYTRQCVHDLVRAYTIFVYTREIFFLSLARWRQNAN